MKKEILGEIFMNKKMIGRFIFYFLGLSAPWIMAFIWDIVGKFMSEAEFLSNNLIIFWFFGFPFFGFFLAKKIEKFQYNFYRSKGVKQSLEAINKLSTTYWILSFFFSILILLPLSMGNLNSLDAEVSEIKNILVNGIKECVVIASDNKTTNFSDAQSFLGNFRKFKIQPLDRNSCYKAKAVPTNNQHTWFEIDYDPETGTVSKTCGDSSKQGCEEGNTW